MMMYFRCLSSYREYTLEKIVNAEYVFLCTEYIPPVYWIPIMFKDLKAQVFQYSQLLYYWLDVLVRILLLSEAICSNRIDNIW